MAQMFVTINRNSGDFPELETQEPIMDTVSFLNSYEEEIMNAIDLAFMRLQVNNNKSVTFKKFISLTEKYIQENFQKNFSDWKYLWIQYTLIQETLYDLERWFLYVFYNKDPYEIIEFVQQKDIQTFKNLIKLSIECGQSYFKRVCNHKSTFIQSTTKAAQYMITL